MNRTITRTVGTLLALGALAACGSEDTPEVNYHNPSAFFQPSADDNSQEAQMRRDFQGRHGSYLLFNDTLQSQLLGTDINGDPRYFVETVDLTYSVGQGGYGKSSTTYSFTYLTDLQQKQTILDFIESSVLPHFSSKFMPFSWLLVNTIKGKLGTSVTAQTNNPYAVVGQRCIAIAGNYLIQRERTDAQKQNYTNRVLTIIVGQQVKAHEDSFADFYAVSEEYYGKSGSDLGLDNVTAPDLYGMGFLAQSTGVSSLTDFSTDLSTFASNAVQYSREEILKRFDDYPRVLQKDAIMRERLVSLGYVF